MDAYSFTYHAFPLYPVVKVSTQRKGERECDSILQRQIGVLVYLA